MGSDKKCGKHWVLHCKFYIGKSDQSVSSECGCHGKIGMKGGMEKIQRSKNDDDAIQR